MQVCCYRNCNSSTCEGYCDGRNQSKDDKRAAEEMIVVLASEEVEPSDTAGVAMVICRGVKMLYSPGMTSIAFTSS